MKKFFLNLFHELALEFDKLPKRIQAYCYMGFSGLCALGAIDILKLGANNSYVAIIVGVISNILAYEAKQSAVKIEVPQ